MCIRTCTFPDGWKGAKVIPIPKTAASYDINNFRPISILSVLSKPLEKHINSHVVRYMENHNLFYQFQLTRMSASWLSAINDFKLVGAVFLDINKAFETVDHNLLITKIRQYTRCNATVNLLASFVTNRTQKLYINGQYSREGHLSCGVPQGSILGPLLFCIFINDMPWHITNKNVSCELFADDSSLHTSARTTDQLESDLQQGINDVVQWSVHNKLTLHPKKIKEHGNNL